MSNTSTLHSNKCFHSPPTTAHNLTQTTEQGTQVLIRKILLFGYVLTRLVRLAAVSESSFAGLSLLGIFGAWLVHVLVNIGMTAGVVPVTGIPLPFVSYGGTFLVMSWLAVAIAVRLSNERI